MTILRFKQRELYIKTAVQECTNVSMCILGFAEPLLPIKTVRRMRGMLRHLVFKLLTEGFLPLEFQFPKFIIAYKLTGSLGYNPII